MKASTAEGRWKNPVFHPGWCVHMFGVRNQRDDNMDTICMYGHTYSKSMDQPGKVANPARGQLNRQNEFLPVRVRA